MAIAMHNTVGELATKMPAATRVFERYGIDYCCNGQRSLAEACEEARLQPSAIMHALEQLAAEAPPNENDWSEESLTELQEFIVSQYHVSAREDLIHGERLFIKVCEVHSERHPELTQAHQVWQALQAELLTHMAKEEQVLFPFIQRLDLAARHEHAVPHPAFGTVQNPVRMMRKEHDEAGAMLQELRELTADFTLPSDDCASYRALIQLLRDFTANLHHHIHLENNILFPRVIALESELITPE